MTSRAPTSLSSLRLAFGLVGAAAVVLALGCSGAPSTGPSSQGSSESEETVRTNVRNALAKAADVDTCRAALEQLNNFLTRQPQRKVPPLSAEERQHLEQHYALDAQELAEVDSPTFTTLDSHYLDLCLLLRDAARAQGLKAPARLDQARQAFAWVMREVRLRAGEEDPLPPEFVLRRGWGTAPERALVFVSLLHQLRVPGCVLVYGNEAGKPAVRFWLAGALVDKQVYLFDPRLGLPLPGPKGEGVATLAQLKNNNGADILPQVAGDAKHPYDVTPAALKGLEVRVSGFLTALAPRMRFLQNDILAVDAAADTPQLAVDPGVFQHFAEATQGLGVPVRAWPEATRSLRSFLPREQGGSDTTEGQGLPRQRRFEQELVPWHVLPEQIRSLPGTAGQPLLQIFSQPFREFYLAPRMPRELMLRGRYDEATRELVSASQDLDRHRAMPAAALKQIEQQVTRWSKEYVDASAELILAQESGSQTPREQEARGHMEQLWKDGAPYVSALMSAATAEPQGSEVTYHLALCKHELAQRAEARSAGSAAAREKAEDAWKEAVYWWERYGNDYALTVEKYRRRLEHIRDLRKGRGQATLLLPFEVEYLARDLSTAVSARILHAEALVRLHQPEPAKALLEGLVRELGVLESSGDLAEVENPDHRGAALWFLVAAPQRIRQLK